MLKLKGNLFAFLGTSIFALNFISMKVLVGLLPPKIIIVLRFALASLFLFAIFYFQNKEIIIKDRAVQLRLILTGLLGMSLYYLFFTYSLQYISPSLTSLLCSLIPLITLFFDSLFFKKKLEKITFIMFLLSIFGVYLVIDVSLDFTSYLEVLKGVLLMFCALIAWISYTFTTEELMNKYDSILMIAYQCFYGALITALFAFDDLDALFNIFESPNLNLIILNIIFVSVFASALAYLFYNLGIKYIGVTLSSVYMNTMPVITVFAAYFLLDSTLTLKKISGIFIVASAAVATVFKDRLQSRLKNIVSS